MPLEYFAKPHLAGGDKVNPYKSENGARVQDILNMYLRTRMTCALIDVNIEDRRGGLVFGAKNKPRNEERHRIIGHYWKQ